MIKKNTSFQNLTNERKLILIREDILNNNFKNCFKMGLVNIWDLPDIFFKSQKLYNKYIMRIRNE